MAGSIFTHIDHYIATVTFSHPQSNSFPGDLLQKLVETFDRLSTDDKVRVIVLQSEGEKTFCAGASFDELMAINDLESGKSFFSGFANLINAMRKCSKIIIGRVQGKSVGGGVGILASCDYVFATEAADIKLSELSIGIGPFVIAPALERKMGVSAFSELSLDAKNWKTAYWAQKKGLFNRVFETIRDMDEGIDFLSLQLSQYNPEALFEMKKVFWEGTEHWDELLLQRAEISGKLVLSDFTKKALAKFRS
ncbi:enoyl-CoA hydratase/isomerase family protein [Lutimonas halocynthiae]|uniref:enoyl-CoA hydratase/isomerase family protein n=1 Tax=Lutimonas halocynthiae TaxID=1446477 RepID=UPI0025B3C68D|nr:enoyl-CoA hydratase/isomerase family protein [Lutimonas halocynthiae]MDN3641083.1 enoyl-CoA hydratase/isomerase family protein [Lutimonas halocynthiae]